MTPPTPNPPRPDRPAQSPPPPARPDVPDFSKPGTLYTIHCQHLFNDLRTNQEQIKTALLGDGTGPSLSASTFANTRAIRFLVSLHLAVMTAALAVMAQLLISTIRQSRPALKPGQVHATPPTKHAKNQLPFDEHPTPPVESGISAGS